MNPFLSVIIPTFNSENTLDQALDSILKQTFKDYEILIIDNNSTDSTISIVKGSASLNNPIRSISETDKGIYDAMNKGIRLAKGEWLYFMGCDDKLFNSEVLQQVNNEIIRCNYDVIYGDVYSTRFKGRYDGEFNDLKILSQNICHQAIFIKKKVFNKIGLFDLRYKSHADWDHNMNWFLSRKISKKYFKCIVAEYADGGYSSLNFDPLFGNEKILKYLIYGRAHFTFRFRISLLIQELKRTANKYNKYLFFKIVFNIPRILTGV